MKFIKVILVSIFIFLLSCKEERDDVAIPVQSNDKATLILFTTKNQNMKVYIDENYVGDILDSTQYNDCQTEGLRLTLKPGGYDVYFEGTYTAEVEGEEDLDFENSGFVELGINECISNDVTFYKESCLNCRTIKQ